MTALELRLARKALMLAAAQGAGYDLVFGLEKQPTLPIGIYPCRVMFAIAWLSIPAVLDEAGKIVSPAIERPFNSWDSFRLNEDRTGVIVTANERKEVSKFKEPTNEIGIFCEVVEGKFAENHAHIPIRFNVEGYARREDYADLAWDAAGLENIDGYAAKLNPDGSYSRVKSEKRTLKGKGMLAGFLGAVYEEDCKEKEQFDLQLDVEEGLDLFVNVVMKEDRNDKDKRIVPTFFNAFDSKLCTHKVETLVPETSDETQAPD